MTDSPQIDFRDPENAFQNAVRLGMSDPDDYMYMYSYAGFDYFKHCDTRDYVSFPYD